MRTRRDRLMTFDELMDEVGVEKLAVYERDYTGDLDDFRFRQAVEERWIYAEQLATEHSKIHRPFLLPVDEKYTRRAELVRELDEREEARRQSR